MLSSHNGARYSGESGSLGRCNAETPYGKVGVVSAAEIRLIKVGGERKY